jgi:choline dehydrogenase
VAVARHRREWRSKGVDLQNFVRDAATTYSHETCTAKMGRDSMSVVDGYLKVHGVDNLRIADGSIMPRVTTGNTMAPCVIIGERAAEILRTEHKLHTSMVDEGGKSRSAEIGPLNTPANLERVGASGRTKP